MSTLVILPGWGHDERGWLSVADSFRGKLDTRIIELPGFGNEPLVSGDWGVPEYADWVEAKIQSLGLTDVILLGHSFGGRITGVLAARRPSWLKAIILYGTPGLYRPSLWTRVRILLAKIVRAFGLKRKGSDELGDADSRGMGGIFRRVVPFDQTATLPLIQIPTLLLWGAEDDAAPLSIGRKMHELIPGSQLVVLPKLGHTVHSENPHLFHGTVIRFIESL